MARKRLTRSRLLDFLGVTLLVLAVALFCAALLFQDPDFLARYDELMQRLAEFEYAVATLPYRGLVVVVILLLFLAKAVIPLPISAVCVIAGMAFRTPIAILINAAGYLLLTAIKYFWGKHLGGGLLHKLLVRYENVERILNNADTRTKGVLLFGFRLVSFPINTISQVYGAMQFDLRRYLVISMLGFLPKLLSYSFIGRHVYDPFSMAFILPVVLLLAVSGISLLAVNRVLAFYNDKIKNKEAGRPKESGAEH